MYRVGDGGAVLDTYRARHADGWLRDEAARARVDALLVLGRDDEALGELRGLTLRPHGRDQELRARSSLVVESADAGDAHQGSVVVSGVHAGVAG